MTHFLHTGAEAKKSRKLWVAVFYFSLNCMMYDALKSHTLEWIAVILGLQQKNITIFELEFE